jgi:hypothetical protein
MSGIFISYRREDSAGFAGRLADALEKGLGAEQVFRDVDDIRPGQDFVTTIQDQLRQMDVMLVLIGPRWLSIARDGHRRLDDPEDFVRLEVRLGLELNKPVIPVLVGGAAMPAERDLPEDLRPLARRQAFSLSEAGWKTDLTRLIQALQPLLTGRRRTDPTGRRLAWGLAGVILVLSLGVFMLWPGRELPPTSTPPPQVPSQAWSPTPAQPPQAVPPALTPPLVREEPSAPPVAPSARAPAARLQPVPIPQPPAVQSQPEASAALAGRWTARIRYDWGDVHPEVFEFEVAQGEVFGVVSYLGTRRAILAGRIDGNRLSFQTQSQEMLGGRDEVRTVTHRYRGVLDGDVIRFTLESGGGHSFHEPVQFDARRLSE